MHRLVLPLLPHWIIVLLNKYINLLFYQVTVALNHHRAVTYQQALSYLTEGREIQPLIAHWQKRTHSLVVRLIPEYHLYCRDWRRNERLIFCKLTGVLLKPGGECIISLSKRVLIRIYIGPTQNCGSALRFYV